MFAHLKRDIARLARDAEQRPDVPQRMTIAPTLRLDVKITRMLTLVQLSMAGQYPTATQLKELIAIWPYEIDANNLTITHFHHTGRLYLATSWPTPTRLLDVTETQPDSTAPLLES